MKKLLLLLCLVTLTVTAQERMGEKQAKEDSHINFKTHYLYFVLHGEIEIDGHIFKNHKKKECPLIYTANLEQIQILDTCTGVKYKHVGCSKEGCNIIHLEKITPVEESTRSGFELFNSEYFQTVPGIINDGTNTLELRY